MDMKVAYHTGVLCALSRVSSAGNVRKDARDEAPTSGGKLDQRLLSVVVGNVGCLHPLTRGEGGMGRTISGCYWPFSRSLRKI